MKLSERLHLIANNIATGSSVADIGSDHALLPVYLIQSGTAEHVIAGEVAEGPWKAAKKQVQSAGLSNRIDVRRGDGLEVIEMDEVDVVTIAGMGGSLICRILTEGIKKLDQVKTLILQPNVAEDAVRRWLCDHEWFLEKEWIIEEDGHIYEILKATRYSELEKEKNKKLYEEKPICSNVTLTKDELLQFGPYIINENAEVFYRKWNRELDKLEKIKKRIMRSSQEQSRQKFIDVSKQIERMKEVLACLQKGN